jgi:hypothetical protein
MFESRFLLLIVAWRLTANKKARRGGGGGGGGGPYRPFIMTDLGKENVQGGT